MLPPDIEFAFEINVDVPCDVIQELGRTPKGIRKIVPITGGTFNGPAISGKIIPGGYDWQLLREDGVTEIEARYVLQTNDGALITIVNTGLRHGSPEVMQKMAKGELVDPSLYYFRSIPVFETGSKEYEWLTKNIFIANGIRKPAQVIIQVWKVL